MNLLLSRMDEQQRRWYVGLESMKTGHGGDTRLAQITGMNVQTIRRGRRELEDDLNDRPDDRVRLEGGGRPLVEKKTPPDPLTLLIGLPRPQTARDILRDATTLGVGAIHFVRTMRSDPNYASSSLWTSGEWRRHLIAGAEQAFDTRIPMVTWTQTLAQALTTLPTGAPRLALDNYEGSAPLAGGHPANDHAPMTLAIGPERGWAAEDRDTLRAAGFTLVHLGSRVLRTETAMVAALAILRAGMRPTSTAGIHE